MPSVTARSDRACRRSRRAGIDRVGAALVLTMGLVVGFGAFPATARTADAGCLPTPVAVAGSLADGRADPEAAVVAGWEEATQQRLAQLGATLADDVSSARVVVPVAWHIVHAGSTFFEGTLERRTVRAAIRQVNRGFRGGESEAAARTPFRFELVDITSTRNAEWFTNLRYFSPEERAMKTALRTGDAGTLNIYSVRPVAGVSGWATFPQEYDEDPVMDGVVIHFGSVPGGFIGGEGDILTHEVGHWIGLFHTFQGGCTPPGDQVDDTPYEASSARVCDEPRDTCEAPGDDPVHNYMDYARDQCKDQFTPGQRQRLVHHWRAWRAAPTSR